MLSNIFLKKSYTIYRYIHYPELNCKTIWIIVDTYNKMTVPTVCYALFLSTVYVYYVGHNLLLCTGRRERIGFFSFNKIYDIFIFKVNVFMSHLEYIYILNISTRQVFVRFPKRLFDVFWVETYMTYLQQTRVDHNGNLRCSKVCV